MDKLICVGKNYREHALELGDAVPEKPVLFLKPPSVIVQGKVEGETVRVALPQGRGAVHHECEIVVRIDAAGTIDAVTLGLDMTLREVQTKLKKQGHPWELGKVFAGSAILAPWRPADPPSWMETDFEFRLDGTVRQKGSPRQMTLAPAECVRYARDHFPLVAGDAIYTGTPAGVGPVEPGQVGELVWGGQVLLKVAWVAS